MEWLCESAALKVAVLRSSAHAVGPILLVVFVRAEVVSVDERVSLPVLTMFFFLSMPLNPSTRAPRLPWSFHPPATPSVCRCGLRELDPSLRLLPRVRQLSLAHNRLGAVDFFQDCAALEVLDMSFNRLE